MVDKLKQDTLAVLNKRLNEYMEAEQKYKESYEIKKDLESLKLMRVTLSFMAEIIREAIVETISPPEDRLDKV
ncbi:hypothetical protein LS66_003795 [Helicobacter sp. MIT 03-1614]|uniref:Uncharacterized protein n=1 Tax=Helicobacter hepaticus (strain ATCC 51449 / 3B1) TaxID=235279 RepID=Q7VIH3_HELHP|nr:hypothetical protein [Helicobacter sp. MIT 03-1614]AAP77229.1 hypothetical protein HH_0632 [Helicobacter hepaticus ATCC 51449]TLD89997.1 hypothetical protein LS66_003795 [Helicobacter sp. MIT 03-1614]